MPNHISLDDFDDEITLDQTIPAPYPQNNPAEPQTLTQYPPEEQTQRHNLSLSDNIPGNINHLDG